MRGVSSLFPARRRFASSVPARLALCLALLHGCGHAVSEETVGGPGEIDVAERVVERMEGIGKAVDGDVRIVVLDCDVKVEGKCGESKALAGDAGRSTESAGESAGGAVDEAAKNVANVGGCSGKRFKKCR